MKPKLLVFVVAYNAERTIGDVLRRVPAALARDYAAEVLVIDDHSADRTSEAARRIAGRFPTTVLRNPANLGYGGNQKRGYDHAVAAGFDLVALLHGDGQHAPEQLPELAAPVRDGRYDVVLGSRMLGRALAGGMPLYKFVGNKVLTRIQNHLLRSRLSEFHTGYRVYSAAALRRIPYRLNSDDFHFDTEILIQSMLAGMRIGEVPVATHYGDEVCHVNGLRYAWNVVRTTLAARAQALGVAYAPRYDSAAYSGTTDGRPK